MKSDVQICVDSRLNMFSQYFTVPPAMQEEVDGFVADILALGERAADVAAFEAEFASSGLSDRFNSILPRLTPKAVEMTAEQKAYAKQAAREVNPVGDVAKYVAKSAIDSASVAVEEELIAATRKKMIENETFDEFTKLSNIGDTIETLGNFFRKKN